jgi:hypothetical protein
MEKFIYRRAGNTPALPASGNPIRLKRSLQDEF